MRLTLKAYDPPLRERERQRRRHRDLMSYWQAELLSKIHAGRRTKSRSGKPLKYWER